MQVSDALTGSINLPSAGLEVGDFDLISTIQINSAQSSVTFGGIPQNYRHLQIRGTIMVSGSTNPSWSVNGDTDTSKYFGKHFWGTGAAAVANYQSGTVYFNYNVDGTNPSTFVMEWLDYASTNKTKTMRTLAGCDTNGGTVEVALWSGLYNSLNAINSITLSGTGLNFVVGTSFSLYGMRG